VTPDVARVGRCYTAARRHPWVLGKVADFKIPLGPYTPAQIALAVGGGFLLVKTVSWWSWTGPVPIVAWVLAIWMVRWPKIAGRAPMQAAPGCALLGWQPMGGRIGGRAARDRTARWLLRLHHRGRARAGPRCESHPITPAAPACPRAPLPQLAAHRRSCSGHGPVSRADFTRVFKTITDRSGGFTLRFNAAARA
jgi:hypothetical protein